MSGRDIHDLLTLLKAGEPRALARAITVAENDLPGSDALLTSLSFDQPIPVIGVTGPPGAGKSTMINALIRQLTAQQKKIAVVAVDPTSPFNFGSLLGDRLRMAEHFNNPNVFIRSLATRGSLGGLSSKIIEVTDVLRAAPFDYIIVETVGVGQSEVEIVGLADTTIVIVVPEAGDEVQTLKSGVMEIADIFVVNKSDRDGASTFAKNLQQLVHSHHSADWLPPVIKAAAVKEQGITEILDAIIKHQPVANNTKRPFLLAEKAYQLILHQRMKSVNKQELKAAVEQAMQRGSFNLYSFVRDLTPTGK